MNHKSVETALKVAEGKLAAEVGNGYFSVTIDVVADRAAAIGAFKAAHTAYAHIDNSIDDIPYTPSAAGPLDIAVVLPPAAAQKTVSAGLAFLDHAELRPLTFAELVAAGTKRLEFAMQDMWFLMALGTARPAKDAFPTLRHSGGHRVLIADMWDPWNDMAAWLATPKV